MWLPNDGMLYLCIILSPLNHIMCFFLLAAKIAIGKVRRFCKGVFEPEVCLLRHSNVTRCKEWNQMKRKKHRIIKKDSFVSNLFLRSNMNFVWYWFWMYYNGYIEIYQISHFSPDILKNIQELHLLNTGWNINNCITAGNYIK